MPNITIAIFGEAITKRKAIQKRSQEPVYSTKPIKTYVKIIGNILGTPKIFSLTLPCILISFCLITYWLNESGKEILL